MKLYSIFLATFFTVALFAVLLLSVGVGFHSPAPASGANLYNPSNEISLTGTVAETKDFACPVSDGEMGGHILLKTAEGVVQVHLAPSRVLRSQKLTFRPGESLAVVGSKIRLYGKNDVIAREISRGDEQIFVRDPAGKLLLTQP